MPNPFQFIPLLSQTQSQAGQSQFPFMLWGIICFAVGVILVAVELFIPSGGLLALSAGAALVTGIVLMFLGDHMAGLVAAILTLIAVPFFFAFIVKLWPNTPIARMLLLKTKPPVPPRHTAEGEDPESLVGASGRAISDLRPVGMCVINGKRIECLAQDGVITAGTSVRVVSADGVHVKVRVDE